MFSSTAHIRSFATVGKHKVNISVFPKWVLLNSMNCDKAQNLNSYQEYSIFANSYILKWSSRRSRMGRSSDYRAGGQQFKSWHPTWNTHVAKVIGCYAGIIHWQRCHTRGESQRTYISHMLPPSANKAEPTLALKPRGDITRSPKEGYQCPHKNF